jgi:chloramphenicol O-acetyltransferase
VATKQPEEDDSYENKDLEYIEHYKKIYRNIIKEAKRRENNSYINSAKNKSKAVSM